MVTRGAEEGAEELPEDGPGPPLEEAEPPRSLVVSLSGLPSMVPTLRPSTSTSAVTDEPAACRAILPNPSTLKANSCVLNQVRCLSLSITCRAMTGIWALPG